MIFVGGLVAIVIGVVMLVFRAASVRFLKFDNEVKGFPNFANNATVTFTGIVFIVGGIFFLELSSRA